MALAEGHSSVTRPPNGPEKIEKAAKINQLHTQTFAYLLEKMRSTPDGDGTLLDHSMILYGSSISDGNAHTHDNLPLVLAGGGCGQIKGNRHIRFAKETPMNNLLLTMLSKAGLHPSSKLGHSNGFLQPISEA